MIIKAIIFDVDGTLADTEDGHRKSFNKAFAESGLDWNWDVALYDKLLKVTGGKERIKYFVEVFPAGLHQARRLRRLREESARGQDQALHRYAGRGADSAASRHQAADPRCARRRHQARHRDHDLAGECCHSAEVGLGKNWADYFAANGCGDIVPHKKPAPDIYFWVLDKLGLSAAECIALEDSNNGLRSSLAAGIKTFVTINPLHSQPGFRRRCRRVRRSERPGCILPHNRIAASQTAGFCLAFDRRWGCSSVGRASGSQSEGRQFDPDHLHQYS